MERTDAELISAYKEGDQEALAALVRRYTRQIYVFVARQVGDDHDAEDVVQTVFVNIWKNLEKFDTSKSFKTWAYAIARNAAIDHLRKRKLVKFSDIDRFKGDEEEGFEHGIPSGEVSAEERLAKAHEDEARSALLNEALLVLNQDERTVVALHTEEESTFEEIGEAMGKSPNTVKSQYRRALAKLKKALAPEE